MTKQRIQVVGGYGLDLYCGVCPSRIPDAPHEWATTGIGAASKAGAYRQAREHGWRVMGDRATCPTCRGVRTTERADA